jgi:hypothetical protein
MQLVQLQLTSVQVSFITRWRWLVTASVLLQLMNRFSVLLDRSDCLIPEFVLAVLVESVVCCFVLSLGHHLDDLLGQEINLRLFLNFFEFLFLGSNLELL